MAETSAALAADDPRMRRRLVTPEGVDLGLTLASAGQRLTAFMLDGVIMIGVLIAVTLLGLAGLLATGGTGSEILLILWLLGFFVLRNGYFILLEAGSRAATLGKRVAGLRVVARDGGRLTIDAVIARNLMREIEVYLPLSFLGYRSASGLADTAMTVAGLVWAGLFLFFPLLNKDRLRIGDMLAGTWVINAPRRRLTADLMVGQPQAQAPAFTDEQLEAYGIYELQTLEGVLRDLNPDAMSAVSWTIRNKIDYAGGIESDEAFLRAYYEALRKRLERQLLFGRRRADKHDR